MASYTELYEYAGSPAGQVLKNRIRVAAVVACDVISAEAGSVENHANRLKWAVETLRDLNAAADPLTLAVLAQNRGFTTAQITQATDVQIQTAVDNAIDLLAQG